MRARPSAGIEHAPQLEAEHLSLQRHHHVTVMAVRVNPAKIVQHAPVDMFEVWCAEILLSCLRKRGTQLFVGDRLQNESPECPDADSLQAFMAIAIGLHTGQGSGQI